MVFQPINDIAEICSKMGISKAIISPGSRNAPLTLAFVRHPEIRTFVIPDERSAGFIGLGMVLEDMVPVVLICTSGSAVLNYGPSIAEAFFQRVPLLVVTADRPPELIDQQDGQTIYQEGVYGKHVKKSYHFDPGYSTGKSAGIISESIQEAVIHATNYPPGPVHINLPFREPFYPGKDEKFGYSKIKLIDQPINSFLLPNSDWVDLETQWNQSKRILVLGRQSNPDELLLGLLEELPKNVVLAGDIISNLHKLEKTIRRLDTIPEDRNLIPDLLVTFGNSGISKRLKLFLRKHPPQNHWHIQPAGIVADTYQSITRVIHTTPEIFFTQCKKWGSPVDDTFLKKWNNTEEISEKIFNDLLQTNDFGEFSAVNTILKFLPPDSCLHLANSLSVRLASYIGLRDPSIKVYANRGTSGIDGSNSSATGMALISNNPVVLITGDMAFFYDRNAFWHNYNPENLFIIVLNNHAGGIFGVIDGPSGLPELQEYFETNQRLTANNLANEHQLDYSRAETQDQLNKALEHFFTPGNGPKILEIITELDNNKTIFRKLIKAINQQ